MKKKTFLKVMPIALLAALLAGCGGGGGGSGGGGNGPSNNGYGFVNLNYGGIAALTELAKANTAIPIVITFTNQANNKVTQHTIYEDAGSTKIQLADGTYKVSASPNYIDTPEVTHERFYTVDLSTDKFSLQKNQTEQVDVNFDTNNVPALTWAKQGQKTPTNTLPKDLWGENWNASTSK